MPYENKLICDNLSVNDEGHLLFAGLDTTLLAKEYGTPVYLMDEDKIREKCRIYKNAISKNLGSEGRAIYASKAASFKRMYTIMKEEGMYCDVVSCGEIYTAHKAGFPLEKAFFHSNNKTDNDIKYALRMGVGYFVVDNKEELLSLNKAAGKKGIKQKILLRLTPGIDTHTFEAVDTGKVDSKFGFAIETGAAEKITEKALVSKNVELIGFHCHVGSQLFDSDVYIRSAKIMFSYMTYIREKYGYIARMLDLGGGYGVRYLENDPVIDIAENIEAVANYLKKLSKENNYPMPSVSFEPGRSIVADAGLTLYTVGMVKKIPGFINYVSVDGGMADNVRYAMYEAPYTVLPANRMNERGDMRSTVVGRCCESGDIIQPGVLLPSGIKRGDIIAVCTTGAYNYSMASNYNRIPRPPVVMIKDKKPYVAVKGETLDDLIALDE
ncbi:MAG: diaminopimelate decarboxylase [Clostridia bacterium]|nr:diaminopimelate decarboxylase [Clostridia bacterium]